MGFPKTSELSSLYPLPSIDQLDRFALTKNKIWINDPNNPNQLNPKKIMDEKIYNPNNWIRFKKMLQLNPT